MKMTKVTAGELSREQQRRMEVQVSTVTEGRARSRDPGVWRSALR
jgi:hypothetical protein